MSDKINLIEKIKTDKKWRISVVIFLSVLVLVVLLYGVSSNKKKQESQTFSVDSYVEGLETKLENTLKKVEGAGKVSVVITVESGMETVLAMKTTVKETSNGRETEETPIIVNGKTVVLKECYPKVVGVLIVAEGADNVMVYKRLQQATVSLLKINVNQIEILTMK
jgi:stage III sporulation protein AG